MRLLGTTDVEPDDIHFSNLVDAFGRHLVAISLIYRLKEEAKTNTPRMVAFSSTVIRFLERSYLLTAGHVVDEIRSIYANPDVTVESCLIVDNFGYEATHEHSIPFAWSSANPISIDEGGLDIGLVPLQPYYERLLSTNGIVAIDEQHWARQHAVEFDAYVLLGLPAELADGRATDGGRTLLRSVATPLIEIEPPEYLTQAEHPRLVARLRDDVLLNSIKGMSGGPVIGIRREGDQQVRYWIVAIQSAWYPAHRVVTATPVKYFADMVMKAIRED